MPQRVTPSDIPIPDGPSRLVEMNCIMCSYSLNGLEADGLCPECGTAVVLSLRPSPLGYMEAIDAKRLARGVRNLLLPIWILVFQIAAMLLIAVINLQLAWFYTGCAGFFLAIALGLWMIGWHQIARVRAAGRGTGTQAAKGLVFFLAWLQTLCAIGVLVTVFRSRSVVDSQLVLGMLAVVVVMMLGAGQWRLLTLARRGGESGLTESAVRSTRFLAIGIGLWMTTGAVTRTIPWLGLDLSVVVAIFSIAALVVWQRFLLSLAEEADKRAMFGAPDGSKPHDRAVA